MLFTINAVLTIALQKSAKSTTFIKSTIILKKIIGIQRKPRSQ